MLKEEREHIQRSVYDKYNLLYRYINSLGVKQKRNVFRQLRQHAPVTANVFLPNLGITAGQFAVLQKDNCSKTCAPAGPDVNVIG